MDSYDILVIILSVMLATFLLLGSIALMLFIQVLQKAKKVTESARVAAENVETMTSNLKTATGAAVGGTLAKFFKNLTSKKD